MNYTFKIYALNIVDEFVDPDNSEQLKIVPFRTEGQKFIRNKINTNVVLSGTDYTLVYNLLKNNPCVQFRFIITRITETTPIFTGLFTYYNIGNINEDKCTFDFGMIADDLYLQYLNAQKTEFNILTTSQYVNNVYTETNPVVECDMIVAVETEIEYFSRIHTILYSNVPLYPNTWNITSLNTYCGINNYWEIKEVEYWRIAPYFPSPPALSTPGVWRFTGRKEREIIWVANGTGVPDPAIWHFMGYKMVNGNRIDKYARSASYHPSNPIFTPISIDHFTYTSSINYNSPLPSIVTFVNCRKLENVINFALANAGFSNHTSSFMYDLINPITLANPNPLNNILIGQKSDFIIPIDGDPATKGLTTLEDITNMLRDKHNIYYYFDGNTIRFEHEIFFENGLSYNIGSETIITINPNLLIETNKFSIDFSKFIGRETFSDTEQYGEDFIGVPILYGSCMPEKDSEKSTTINDFTTDIMYVYNSVNYGGLVSGSGFVVLQTKNIGSLHYEIENELGILNPDKLYVNGHFAWAMIQERYFKTGVRPLKLGNMNGVDVIFPITEKVKIQTELSFPFCGLPLNFYALLKINDLPAAKMLEASFSLKTEYLTVKLAYDV